MLHNGNWKYDIELQTIYRQIHEIYPKHTGSKNSGDAHIDKAIMLRLIIILGLLMLLFGLWIPVVFVLR